MDSDYSATEPKPRGVGWYLRVLRRRKWLLIVPLVVGLPISIAYALSQTPVYRSTATILVEDPEIPPDLVSTTVTTFAEKRLQVIRQRVMATDSLLDVMRRFDLYPQERASQPVSVVAETMRNNVQMNIVNAEVVDRSGRQAQTTVAFTLSFDHTQPEVAQRVANELVSLYLNQNIIARRQQATQTTEFLASEADRLARRIAQLESELLDLKKEHVGSLPDQLDTQRQTLQRIEEQLRELDRRARGLEERRIFLEAQLAVMAPVSADGALTTGQRLQLARAELASATARYTPDHPDVRRLERQVRGLEHETGAFGDDGALHREQERIQEQLVAAREQYGEDHPDVARLARELAGLESALAQADQPTNGEENGEDNGALFPGAGSPGAVQINAQLIAANSELEAIAEERERLNGRLEVVRELLLQAPLVEQEYSRITRELNAANGAHQNIVAKLSEAQLAEALETERKGERFSLVEPPQLPQVPFKPDRRMIVLVGLFLSLGAGVGAIAATEAMNQTVRDADEVRELLGVSPLVVVPHIRNRAEVVRAWSLAGVTGVVLLGAVVVGALYVHTQVRPLDIVALQIQQRATAALAPVLAPLR